MHKIRLILALSCSLLLGAALPAAAQITLEWDANTDPGVIGYIVQYGPESAPFTVNVDVGNVTTWTLTSPVAGTEYAFRVLAYNTNRETSDPSFVVYGRADGTPMPKPPTDLDGDGIGDITVWRPGIGTWFTLGSMNGYAASAPIEHSWGIAGDMPFMGDLDGDGIADLVVWRPSTGTWYWLTSSSGYSSAAGGAKQWGNQSLGDVPMLADMDGDGMADLVLWRASTGTWYWLTSSSGYSYSAAVGVQWGNQSLGDVPLLGDVDGDGKADLIVWRASNGTWYWLTSSSAYSYAAQGGKQWGNQLLGDVPLVGDIDGDGKVDLTVWRGSTGTWFWLSSSSGYSYAAQGEMAWGDQSLGDMPMLTDIDGDGRADLVVWRTSTGWWYWLKSTLQYNPAAPGSVQWGSKAQGDIPVVK